jgi:hypothetical protein
VGHLPNGRLAVFEARRMWGTASTTAYGWDGPDLSAVPEDDLLSRRLARNLQRSGPTAGVAAPIAAPCA